MLFDEASRGDLSLAGKFPCKVLLPEPAAFSHTLCIVVFLCTGSTADSSYSCYQSVSAHKNLIVLELCIHCPTGISVRCYVSRRVVICSRAGVQPTVSKRLDKLNMNQSQRVSCIGRNSL